MISIMCPHICTFCLSLYCFIAKLTHSSLVLCLFSLVPAMNLDESELMSDPKFKAYSTAVDKALKGFEYSSEWADLISALAKLIKVTSREKEENKLFVFGCVGARKHTTLPEVFSRYYLCKVIVNFTSNVWP